MQRKAGRRWTYICQSRRSKLILVSLAVFNLAILTWSFAAQTSFISWYTNASPNGGTNNQKRHYGSGHLHGMRYAMESPTPILKHFETTTVSLKPNFIPKSNECSDILAGMARGHWVTRSLTMDEQETIDHYLQTARKPFRIPPTFQRADGRCGNISYEFAPKYNFMLFRAICNPKGKTPCCYENKCTFRTIEECQCPTCYDERPAVQAEFAKWQPDNHFCDVRRYTKTQACDALRGSDIVFIGDSFIRHVFAAMAIVLTGNTQDGALKRSISQYQRQVCLGWHQVTGLTCKDLLDDDRRLCNGTVRIRYTQVFPSRDLPKAIPFLKSLHQGKKSLMILGFGIHDDFKVDTVMKNFLLPFMNIHQWINKHPTQISEIAHSLLNYSAPLMLLDKPFMNYGGRDMDNMLQALGLNKSVIAELNRKYWNQSSSPVSDLSSAKRDDSLVFNPIPAHAHGVKSSPQLLWIGTHAPGVIKSTSFVRQRYHGVKYYNEHVFQFLKTWRVPYLDTLEFSKGTVSYDGTHYGWGVNMLKVNMILTHLEKQKQFRTRES